MKYPFTPEHFHTERAVQAQAPFLYEIGDSGLEIGLNGFYDLGELKWITHALTEANRLFRHRNWVEITKVSAGLRPFYQVVRWQGGVANPESELLDLPSSCWDRLHELCKPGHAADFGWLKE